MKKYPKIKRLGSSGTEGITDAGTLFIEEKLDGNNFRFKRYGDQLMFGSRRVVFKEHGDPLPPEEVGGQFQKVSKYLSEKINTNDIKELEKDYGELVFFGENMIKMHLEYDWDNIPQFLGFDIWSVEDEKWLHPEKYREVFSKLGLYTVPLLEKVPVDEFDSDYEVPQSTYRDGKAEGIVIKNPFQSKYAKIKTEKFKELEKTNPSKNKDLSNDVDEMVHKYAPRMRIQKKIDVLTKEQDKDLEMELMEDLPMMVVDDIFEEEYKDIVRSSYSINFKSFRSKVADKCVEVLRDRMRQNI